MNIGIVGQKYGGFPVHVSVMRGVSIAQDKGSNILKSIKLKTNEVPILNFTAQNRIIF